MLTNMIASKTFASQFIVPETINLFQKQVLAIKNKRLDILKSLTLSQQNLFLHDEQNKSLLFYAGYYHSLECWLYLLLQGVDPHLTDNQGKTSIHICCYMGHLDQLNLLSTSYKISKINKLNNQFKNLLIQSHFKRTDFKEGKLKFSVSKQKMEKFKFFQQKITTLYDQYILQNTEQVIKRFKKKDQIMGRNCFHYVCVNRHQKCPNCLEYMINQVKNPNFQLNAEIIQYYEQINPYISQKIDPRVSQNTLDLMMQAVKPQNIDILHKKIHKKYRSELLRMLTTKDKDQHTSLSIASQKGSTLMMTLLQKYEPKQAVQNQQQALLKIASNKLARNHILDLCDASCKNKISMMNFLISCGQNVNKKKTIFGTFALLEAVKAFQTQKNLEPIILLLKSGADYNQQDINGWSVLHHAAKRGYIDIIELLFKQATNQKPLLVNKLTNKGWHPLHLASQANQHLVVDFFLSEKIKQLYGISPDIKDSFGATPLHYAAREGSVQCMKILFRHHCNIYAVDQFNNTALHEANSHHQRDCVKQLLYHDSDYNKLTEMKNVKGKIPREMSIDKGLCDNIFLAAKKGDVNMIRRLINMDDSLKDMQTVIKQRSILMLSVMQLKLINVKYLVDVGADQYAEDIDGKSAIQHANQMLQKSRNLLEITILKNIIQLLQ